MNHRRPPLVSFRRIFVILATVHVATVTLSAAAGELPNPYPRAASVGQQVLRWDFATDAEGWRAVNDCELAARDGSLTIRSSGGDPYLAAPAVASGNEFVVRLRIKSRSDGAGQIFWSSTKHPGSAAERAVTFGIVHDGQWHEVDVRLAIDGDLTALRLDPGTAPGEVQVDWIAVHRGGLHPLEIAAIAGAAARSSRITPRPSGGSRARYRSCRTCSSAAPTWPTMPAIS